MKGDVFASIAIVSLLLNLFFLVAVVMFNSTNNLDEEAYRAAYANLCDKNYEDNLADREVDAEDTQQAADLFNAYCRTGEFTEYFDEAVSNYLTDQGHYE